MVFCGCNTNRLTRNTDADIIKSEATISRDEFEKIETGMTYDEVCEIVGGEGTLGSNVDIGDEEYKTEIYQWSGEGTVGANANVTFQGGKVVSKAQIGLE
ncbi:MAG: DUF3862 domain-containing protein [Clostridia bacterium]|nr:DUF3862 domain-containing protein [Clostridia bacterium]